jgi:exodeoxyribonuclease V alpha subunit
MSGPHATDALAERQAGLLARLCAGGDRDLLRRTMLLLAEQTEHGHVCVHLPQHANAPVPDGGASFPPADDWAEQLRVTQLVGRGDPGEAPTPLVLDAALRLYARRHFVAEHDIAEAVRTRLAAPPLLEPTALAAAFTALGLAPTTEADGVDWQLAAICAAATRRLSVLCGGPGTGKTTTVARLLAVRLHLQPSLKVAITAPTGKAAARLGEALQAQARRIPALLPLLPQLEPRTLHRLLGYLPHEDTFRHGRQHRLRHDLVVVDEASMLDPAVLARLCTALADDAQLVLVGDKDQLAAIAAGQVLSDLCAAAKPLAGVGPALARDVALATGMQLPVQPAAPPIADATINLRTNHRFREQPGIGAFARAMAQRDAALAFATLAHGHEDLVRANDAEQALDVVFDAVQHAMRAAASGDPEAALGALSLLRVLTAANQGVNGAAAWNRRVEARLTRAGHRLDDPWYVGRPILVTSNDHQNQVWNGDLGVTGRTREGQPVVWLRDAHGRARAMAPRRLPAHETAWAMTVHKSQGSEFEQVLLCLPDAPGAMRRASPLWNASLLYTGVTRARRRAIVFGDRSLDDLLRTALGTWPDRQSGLTAALAQPRPPQATASPRGV